MTTPDRLIKEASCALLAASMRLVDGKTRHAVTHLNYARRSITRCLRLLPTPGLAETPAARAILADRMIHALDQPSRRALATATTPEANQS